jgi:hypothetical protein
MTKNISDESAPPPPNEYNIYGRDGFFVVNFTSPYNSLHQISGFKTKDDAQAWIAEAKHLAETYR